MKSKTPQMIFENRVWFCETILESALRSLCPFLPHHLCWAHRKQAMKGDEISLIAQERAILLHTISIHQCFFHQLVAFRHSCERASVWVNRFCNQYEEFVLDAWKEEGKPYIAKLEGPDGKKVSELMIELGVPDPHHFATKFVESFFFPVVPSIAEIRDGKQGIVHHYCSVPCREKAKKNSDIMSLIGAYYLIDDDGYDMFSLCESCSRTLSK